MWCAVCGVLRVACVALGNGNLSEGTMGDGQIWKRKFFRGGMGVSVKWYLLEADGVILLVFVDALHPRLGHKLLTGLAPSPSALESYFIVFKGHMQLPRSLMCGVIVEVKHCNLGTLTI